MAEKIGPYKFSLTKKRIAQQLVDANLFVLSYSPDYGP